MSKYKPYPKYKKSGVEWLGDVPEGWKVKRLKHIAKVNLSNVDKKSKDNEQPILLCNYTDVYYNDFITSDLSFMKATAKDEQIKKFSLEAGDVIITKDSEGAEDIAISTYIPETLKGVICGYHLAQIKPKNFNGNYLFRAFNSNGIHDQFKISANGITRYAVGKDAISNAFFPVPKQKEQKQISIYLDQKTQKIDTLIKKQQTLIKLLKEKRQALISHAVTKGLDDSVDMKDSGVEWLGDVPKRWEQRKLKFFARIKNGQDQKKVITDNGQYPIYGSGGEFGRANNYLYNKVSVLLGRKGTVDKPLFITEPFWTVDTMYFTKINNYTNPRFFYYSCLTIPFTYYQYGSALPSMTQENLHNHHFIAPPLKEQKEIAHYLDQKTQKIDTLITKSTQAIELLKERRTALISAVVTGKVDVR